MKNRPSALVLFDIDGTLLRGAGPHHKVALVEGVRRITGSVASLDQIVTAGSLDCDLITAMLHAQGYGERAIRRLLRPIQQECEKCYLANCPADLTPFLCADVRRTLEAMRAHNIAIGVVSGNFAAIGWKKLELAGLRDYFSIGAFAEDGRTRAHLAKIAFWRARRLARIQPGSRVSLIGDHPNDISAAKANGFQAIAVATGVVSREDLAAAGPDILIDRLGELDLARISDR